MLGTYFINDSTRKAFVYQSFIILINITAFRFDYIANLKTIGNKVVSTNYAFYDYALN